MVQHFIQTLLLSATYYRGELRRPRSSACSLRFLLFDHLLDLLLLASTSPAAAPSKMGKSSKNLSRDKVSSAFKRPGELNLTCSPRLQTTLKQKQKLDERRDAREIQAYRTEIAELKGRLVASQQSKDKGGGSGAVDAGSVKLLQQDLKKEKNEVRRANG